MESYLRLYMDSYVKKDLAIVIKKSKLKTKMVSQTLLFESCQGIENWSVTLTGQADDLDSLRKKELCWISRLST